MRIEEFESALKLPLLAPHAAYLRAISIPTVDLWSRVGESAPDSSRFGGSPFVPADFVWPQHQSAEYRFLGQFNLQQIKNRPDVLPDSGLLSFFYLYDESGSVFWQDPGYVVAFYWSSFDGFVVYEVEYEPKTSLTVEMEGGVDVPMRTHLRDDWPLNDEEMESLHYDLPEVAGMSTERLLGYPSSNTLAYDPTPGEDWISLLNVRSIDELEWCWHDGDTLMVFIEKERLKNRDFTNLKCDAG